MSHFPRRVALAVLLVLAPLCAAVLRGADADPKLNSAKSTQTKSLDFEKLVASLANHNTPPKILGEAPASWPLFPADYDWGEQKRVLDAIQTIIDRTEETWPTLLEHMKDSLYCITFDHDEIAYTHTVGDICYLILRETLELAHQQHIPRTKEAFARTSTGRRLSPEQIKPWCYNEKGQIRPLYEMQIDMCRWAITQIPELRESTEAEKQASIAAIERQIGELAKTHKPVLMTTIILPEMRRPFGSQRAAQIRQDFEQGRLPR